MKKTLLSFALCTFGMMTMVQAQHWCGTDEVRRQLIASDPEYLEREAALEADIRQLIEQNAILRDDEVVIQIPIVFHILHLGGGENLPYDRIQTQMEILNNDFRLLNADASQITPAFQDIAADTRIEFVLATRDPFGNCTNGINRIQTVQTLIGESSSKVNQWPRDQYLNVWVARQLSRPGLLGYALLPAGAEGPAQIFDGIMILSNTVGTTDPYLGRTLTHEIGHFLNLLHVWGDTNEPGVVCGDDGVEDTPITKGSFACRLGAASIDCVEGVEENSQNHMDYSNCPRMYTLGQSDRMRATLNTTTAQRSNLWTESNRIATGIAEGSEFLCGPTAAFNTVVGTNLDAQVNPTNPFNNMSCINVNVGFRDNSSGTNPTEWAWTFEDGNPATSNEQNPVVQFTTPGWKTVSLTASNAFGSSTHTDEYAVLIGGGDAWQGAFYESFEAGPSLWPMERQNFDSNHTEWQRYTGPGAFAGNACARLNSGDRNPFNIINPTNALDIDDLITPNLDLSQFNTGVLSFFFSYSTQTTNLANVTEKLEIYSSTDCGRNWQIRTTIQGQALITGGAVPGPGPWVFRSINLPASVMTNNVRFRFRFISSDFSNDIYIDEINISGPVGIEALDATNMVSLFPNPTNDHFTLTVAGMDKSSTEVMIQDLRGSLVFANVYAPEGGQGIELSARSLGLADGMYLLRVKNDFGISSQKLIVGR
jgi:hypothetical protein